MRVSLCKLRAEILDGTDINIGACVAAAHKLTSGIDDRMKSRRLEDSLSEALQMIPVAKELGFEQIARRHALSILAKVEASLA